MTSDALLSLFSAASLSTALCSICLLSHWLIIEPTGINPLKTVFKVLKFAVKHKRPVRRSAFTYCENEKPSRIDLAKSKYGGSFTNEQVEDVKTCLRMVLVIASITATAAASTSCMSSVPEMLRTEFIYTYLEYSSKDHLEILGVGLGLCAILILPVYKVTILVLIKKYIPSTLKRVGSAQILMTCTSLVLLVLTIRSGTSIMPQPRACLPLVTEHHFQLTTNG